MPGSRADEPEPEGLDADGEEGAEPIAYDPNPVVSDDPPPPVNRVDTYLMYSSHVARSVDKNGTERLLNEYTYGGSIVSLGLSVTVGW